MEKKEKLKISDLFYDNRFLLVFSLLTAVVIWLVVAVVLLHEGICLLQRNRANFKHRLRPPAGGGEAAQEGASRKESFARL